MKASAAASLLWNMIVASATSLLVGCTTYPMGLSKAQWDSLPPAQQAEYQAEQYAIDAERQRMAEAYRQEQQRQAEEMRRAEEKLLSERRANAKYRDIVTVTISGGVLESNGLRMTAAPQAFDLVRGEVRAILLSATAGRYTRTDQINVRFSEDGHTVYINDSAPPRDRIILVNQGWDRGSIEKLRPFNGPGPDRWTSMTVQIKFMPQSGEPETMIIERR